MHTYVATYDFHASDNQHTILLCYGLHPVAKGTYLCSPQNKIIIREGPDNKNRITMGSI